MPRVIFVHKISGVEVGGGLEDTYWDGTDLYIDDATQFYVDGPPGEYWDGTDFYEDQNTDTYIDRDND